MESECSYKRILSIDGGGVRGLSTLLILREIMEEIGRRNDTEDTPLPCQYFEMIGGTSTGGWVAIMLGRLRMSVDECIDVYIDLSKKVFKMDKLAKGMVPEGDTRCRFDYRDLEREIKSFVYAKLDDENASMEDNGNGICPTFVVATAGLHGDGPPSIFRSYKCQGASVSKCAIWEAARATSASPLLFKEICITTPRPGRTFIDGGFTHNNPSELALIEAQRRWPKEKHFCLTSIGTGRQRSIRFVDTGSTTVRADGKLLSRMNTWSGPGTTDKVQLGAVKIQKILEACAKLTQGSEAVHERVLGLSHSIDPTKCFPYHRFNVDKDMEDIELQEWHKMGEMAEHATNYMASGEGELKRDKCVDDLLQAETLKRTQSSATTFSGDDSSSEDPHSRDGSFFHDTGPQFSRNGMDTGNITSSQVEPPSHRDTMKEDIVEDDAFDDDTDSFGGALYPEDDWLSDDAYSRNCTYSPRDSFSQADTLNDTESRNDIFTSQSSYSRDFDHEEQVAPPTPIPQIPIPQIPEKPLSLCAIDFAEAVSREYSLTGKTEFVDCALRVVKQLLGSRRANIETHHLYGQLFFAAGQWSEGCEQFEVVMELNPINALCTPVSYVQQYICDKCFIGRDEDGVSGRRYKCTSCRDYDLCSSCFPPADGDHITGHKFVQIPSDKWMRANGLMEDEEERPRAATPTPDTDPDSVNLSLADLYLYVTLLAAMEGQGGSAATWPRSS